MLITQSPDDNHHDGDNDQDLYLITIYCHSLRRELNINRVRIVARSYILLWIDDRI
jgi:hypothetical protein